MGWFIRYGKPDDVDAILSIWASRMGDDYPDRQLVLKSISDSDSICVVSKTDDGTVCGFGISHKFTVEHVQKRLNNTVPIQYSGDYVGFLDQLCVSETYENNGIGTALTKTRIEALETRDVSDLIAVSWNCGDATGSNRLLESHGFDRHEAVDNYWLEESIATNFVCPCGYPCTCTGVIYIR